MDFRKVNKITLPEGVVSKITMGGTVVWQKSELLPSAYKQVEYIETDGNQYIDTGITASDHAGGIQYKFHGHLLGITQSGTNNYLFGCLSDGARSGNVSITPSQFRLFIGATSNVVWSADPLTVGEDFVINLQATSSDSDAVSGTVNSTELQRMDSVFEACEMPNASIYLFSAYGVAETNGKFYGRLYSFSMKDENGAALRNFVPCYRSEDNVIGLYDTVEGVFYENLGTGAFAMGAET